MISLIQSRALAEFAKERITIVQAHAGTIGVESTAVLGTIFTEACRVTQLRRKKGQETIPAA